MPALFQLWRWIYSSGASIVQHFYEQLRHAPMAVCALALITTLATGLGWMPWLLFALIALSFAFFCWKKTQAIWATSSLFTALFLLGILAQTSQRSTDNAKLEALLASAQIPLIWEVEIERPLGRKAASQSTQVLAKLNTPNAPPLKLAITSDQALPAGAVVRMRGKLEALPPPRNPGGFDRRNWLQAQGIFWQLSFPQIEQVEKRPHSLHALLARLRSWSVSRLQHGLKDNSGKEILPALVLGLSGEIDYALKEQFRAAGALHLFAVSGLHVGLVAALFAVLLRPLPLRYRWPVLLVALATFVVLTGMRPSALRAWVMVALVLFGLLRGRPQVTLNSLGVAALIELLWRPQHLYDPGFQFSYLVVINLILIALPIQNYLLIKPWFRRDPLLPTLLEPFCQRLLRLGKSYAMGLVLISAVSWLAALPITLGQFGLFNPLALALNVILVPLASLALGLGSLGMLASMLWPTLGFPLRLLAQKLTLTMAFLAQEGAKIIPPHWIDRDPLRTDSISRLSLLDLRRGHALLLEDQGRSILIDCGHAQDWEFELKPFLRYRGIDTLDALLLSHADAAHVGGLPALLEEIHVKQLILPPRDGRSQSWQLALEAAREQALPFTRVNQGQIAHLSQPSSLKVLYPPAELETTRADQDLLILRLQLGQHGWLLASDLGWKMEIELAQQAEELQGIQGVILDAHPSKPGGTSSFWQLLSAADTRNSITPAPLNILHTGGSRAGTSDFPSTALVSSTKEHGCLILDFDAQGNLLRQRGWASGFDSSESP